MTSKLPMPADGGGADKGRPDGVNATGGRGTGGESGGAGYPNPHTGKDGNDDVDGFMGHGGQTDIGYHGGGQAGDEGAATDNATTRGDGDGSPPSPGSAGSHPDDVAARTRTLAARDGPVAIVEDSGTAAAETSGRTG